MIIDQRRLGGNARSTVGTITDIYTSLRLLFSRAGDPAVGESNVFSFNDPAGMCLRCSGLGHVVTPDPSTFLDLSRSLEDGGILLPGFGNGPVLVPVVRRHRGLRTHDTAGELVAGRT